MKWEHKIISPLEIMNMPLDKEKVLHEYRDWLLGGKEHEWKYYKNQLGELVLLRS